MRARRAARRRSPAPSLGRRGWSWRERIALLRVASRWRRAGFRALPGETVADLAADLPAAVRRDFIEPLCVAALNTPAERSERRRLPARPARRPGRQPRLRRPAAAARRPRQRLSRRRRWPGSSATARRSGSPIASSGSSATAPAGASTAAAPTASSSPPARSRRRGSSRRTPPPGRRRPAPCATSRSSPSTRAAPAARCRSRCSRSAPRRRRGRRSSCSTAAGSAARPGLLAFVISGAARWVERGIAATEAATLAQAQRGAGAASSRAPLEIVRTIVEKRATFACTPGLVRPPMDVAPGLFACGDYLAGPYPATLEGAVRSGVAAARAATGRSGENSGMKDPA